jgi:hypothetical protein
MARKRRPPTDDERRRTEIARLGVARLGVMGVGVGRLGYAPSAADLQRRLLLAIADLRRDHTELTRRVQRLEADLYAQRRKGIEEVNRLRRDETAAWKRSVRARLRAERRTRPETTVRTVARLRLIEQWGDDWHVLTAEEAAKVIRNGVDRFRRRHPHKKYPRTR